MVTPPGMKPDGIAAGCRTVLSPRGGPPSPAKSRPESRFRATSHGVLVSTTERREDTRDDSFPGPEPLTRRDVAPALRDGPGRRIEGEPVPAALAWLIKAAGDARPRQMRQQQGAHPAMRHDRQIARRRHRQNCPPQTHSKRVIFERVC